MIGGVGSKGRLEEEQDKPFHIETGRNPTHLESVHVTIWCQSGSISRKHVKVVQQKCVVISP